jgi:nucleoside-diphosphate-sugar epimerase
MAERTVVIGGNGNVGRGVVDAFRHQGWEVEVVDPQLNDTFEKLSMNEISQLLENVSHIVYSAECGNRDEYERNPILGEDNDLRFESFCERIYRVNSELTIWYIGGSWTKRKPDAAWLVDDESVDKEDSECNPYELAKKKAEQNARRISDKLGIKIRFLDWASVVPNMAGNFSIPKMVWEAVETGQITYSDGDYGRPLLEAEQAGKILLLFIQNDAKISFQKLLVPGVFIPFLDYAQAVSAVLEEETGKSVKLVKQRVTPDYLRTKTDSKYLKSLNIKIDDKPIKEALTKNARDYLRSRIGANSV